jgi:Ni,Fe-hydrogenase I cytochrome b subunit
METEQRGEDDIALDKARWKNRRRMAWISLISMLIVTGLILFTDIVPESRLTILTEVITWFYFSCASIIGMYMGATTWANIKGNR